MAVDAAQRDGGLPGGAGRHHHILFHQAWPLTMLRSPILEPVLRLDIIGHWHSEHLNRNVDSSAAMVRVDIASVVPSWCGTPTLEQNTL